MWKLSSWNRLLSTKESISEMFALLFEDKYLLTKVRKPANQKAVYSGYLNISFSFPGIATCIISFLEHPLGTEYLWRYYLLPTEFFPKSTSTEASENQVLNICINVMIWFTGHTGCDPLSVECSLADMARDDPEHHHVLPLAVVTCSTIRAEMWGERKVKGGSDTLCRQLLRPHVELHMQFSPPVPDGHGAGSDHQHPWVGACTAQGKIEGMGVVCWF